MSLVYFTTSVNFDLASDALPLSVSSTFTIIFFLLCPYSVWASYEVFEDATFMMNSMNL
jgi:hypothetical protein